MTIQLRTLACALAVPTLLVAQVAGAQPAPGPVAPATPPPAASPAPPSKAEDEARDRFQKGLALSDEEAWDAALVEFLQSRRLHPTRAATKNAAIALRTLKRFDEALEMFEELLKFPGLPKDDHDLADRELKALTNLVGTIAVEGAEAGASVVIDSRARGTIPTGGALRVAAGTHVVRIYKDGFTPFETRVEVGGRQAVTVQAAMPALALSGRLKVTEASGQAVDVVVDNVVVGKTPWEGMLPPGDHTVVLRGAGDLGTQPAGGPVKLGQVTAITLAVERLTATLRVQPTPAGGTVAIDGVSVGRGLWDGHLRAGSHKIEVASEGFLPQVREVSVGDGKVAALAVTLERDPQSALWGENRGKFFVEADGAFAMAPSLGGGVAGACSGSCSAPPALGFLALGRGGYRFPSGFLVGLDAGYLLISENVTGRKASVLPVGLPAESGKVNDALRLSGFLIGGSAGVRLGNRFPVLLRLGTGVLIGSVQDKRTGAFTARDGTTYNVNLAESASATSLYLAPEARVGVRVGGGVEVSAGVEGRFLVGLSTPSWAPNDQKVVAGKDGVGTFPADALSGNVIVMVVPGVGVRYEF